jgi:hypothetical protein
LYRTHSFELDCVHLLFVNYDAFCEAFQRITSTRFHCMVYNANEDDLEKNYLDFSAPKDIPDYKIKFKM